MFGSGATIFAVWAYVIANTQPDSMVELNPVVLASVIGESVERISEAIESLCQPDKMSRSKAYEGKRMIQKGQFLYFVPRHRHYRGLRNDDERKEYFRLKKQEQRQRDKKRQTGMSKCPPRSTAVHQTAYAYASVLPEGVRGRFIEWIEFRKANGKSLRNFDAHFQGQAKWLCKFSEADQLEILDTSIRNAYQGLFPLRGRTVGSKTQPKQENEGTEV